MTFGAFAELFERTTVIAKSRIPLKELNYFSDLLILSAHVQGHREGGQGGQ